MKTMTCMQMGGPCEAPIQGSTPQEMAQNGGAHLKEMADKGDDAHKQALAMMQTTQGNPDAEKKWMDDFTAKFNALPEA